MVCSHCIHTNKFIHTNVKINFSRQLFLQFNEFFLFILFFSFNKQDSTPQTVDYATCCMHNKIYQSSGISYTRASLHFAQASENVFHFRTREYTAFYNINCSPPSPTTNTHEILQLFICFLYI